MNDDQPGPARTAPDRPKPEQHGALVLLEDPHRQPREDREDDEDEAEDSDHDDRLSDGGTGMVVCG